MTVEGMFEKGNFNFQNQFKTSMTEASEESLVKSFVP